MTKVEGSNVTFLNSSCVAQPPRRCLPSLQSQDKVSPESHAECQKSRPAAPPQQRWVAVAGSSDRPAFSLKTALSTPQHRNLLLLKERQTSLPQHHSGTRKRDSRLRSHRACSQYDTLATKSSLGTIIQLAHSQFPCNASGVAAHKIMCKCGEQSSLKVF